MNAAPVGNDVAAADELTFNYMVELVLSDADMSRNGSSDSLQIPPYWARFNYEEAANLQTGADLFSLSVMIKITIDPRVTHVIAV